MAITRQGLALLFRCIKKEDITSLVEEFNHECDMFKLKLELKDELMRIVKIEADRKVPLSLWKSFVTKLRALMRYKLEKEIPQVKQKKHRHRRMDPEGKTTRIFHNTVNEERVRKRSSPPLPKDLRDRLLPKVRNLPLLPSSRGDSVEVKSPNFKPIFYPGGAPGLGRRGKK